MTHRLATTTPRHGELARLAACVGVSPRTLRAWRAADRAQRAAPGEEPVLLEPGERRVGRPPRSARETERAEPLVRAAFEQLAVGHDGWRSVAVLLERRGERVPTRLVQELVRALKLQRAQRAAARIAANRVHVEVLARDAVWGVDSTLLGRDAQGEIHGLVMHDLCSRRILGVSVGRKPKAADVIGLFDAAVAASGGAPMVLVFDNGGENRAHLVQERLAAGQVVPLWNLPYTPEHNAWTERRIEDLKAAAGLGKKERRAAQVLQTRDGSAAPSAQKLFVRLVDAWVRLDHDTPRADFLGLTPAELDRIAPQADACVRRARFYEDVCSALETARALHAGARARRRAEREAIWCALERNGLVTRTRGGGAVMALKAEGVS